MPNEKTLSTKGLVKSYGGRRVVNQISVELRQGEIVGLLGPNGAGKTTTFNMIVGLIRPEEGRVSYGDRDITSMPMYQRARLGIGYLTQDQSVFRKLTVEENILSVLQTTGLSRSDQRTRLAELIEEMGLEKVVKNKAYALSGGERRRCEIARALTTSPSFMLLDEPFSGVDPKAVEDLQEIIYQLRRKGLGLLITDHSVRETLTVTDRAYLIYEGKILISGVAEKLVNDPQARKLYLGERFYMDTTPDERKSLAGSASGAKKED